MFGAFMLVFLFVILPIFVIGKFIHGIITGHKWTYRNPYHRTCNNCKRDEMYWCNSWDSHLKYPPGWWEQNLRSNINKDAVCYKED